MGRTLRPLACAVAGIVLGLTLYSGLVHIGLARVEYTAPGWSLHQAAEDDGLTKLLHDPHWDVVVLQEKSWLLSLPEDRWRRGTYPYARDLREKISASGAGTLLFMTWGYALGDRWHEPHDTYAAMQGRLAAGYSRLGEELGAQVAPAELAWAEALRREPGLDLWADDGKHPARSGSYLAGCVFYAARTGRDPARSGFTAGIEPGQARFLQQVAENVHESALMSGSS